MSSEKKLRFQHQNFKKKLVRARGYKRVAKSTPSRFGQTLKTIGLGNIFVRIAFVFVCAFCLWLMYIPNIFFIKNLEILGLGNLETDLAKKNIENYLDRPSFWPQKNLLLLNKLDLSAFILQNENYSEIQLMKKKFPNSLNLQIKSRTGVLQIQQGQDLYTISDDGIIVNTENLFSSSSSSIILPKIVIKNPSVEKKITSPVFKPEDVTEFLNLYNKISLTEAGEINYIEIFNLSSNEFILKMQKSYEIWLTRNSDTQNQVSKILALFKTLNPEQISNIAYINLQINDRAFICFKNTPCDKNSQMLLEPTNSTSTK